jgi:hypothetical protein
MQLLMPLLMQAPVAMDFPDRATFERLLRKLLNRPRKPAVLLLDSYR